ncbi:TonB-dependent receptor [Hyphomonadaceae bacterium ML37]|nr:TonB-dependent receptor [Hyphomonadaceae bacterium ML37]
MKIWEKERLLRSTILAGFAAVSMTGAVAYGQSEEDEDEEDTPPPPRAQQSSDRIVVTGSLLRRDEFTSSAPIQVITAEIASIEGLVDTAEILQDSSIAAGSQQINTQFGGFIVNGGPGVQTVSLRGLGAQRTLLLFNGRRFGPSGVEGRVGAVDLNTIPQSAVQRIEILKDGASSIYGSDAVAGVINVITRTQIDRPSLRVSASVPFEGAGETYTVDGAMGFNFDRGFITASASYTRVESISRADRDYFSCAADYVFDPVTGARIDRTENNPTSPNAGNFKCFNTGVINSIDVFNGMTRRFVIDPNATPGQLAAGVFPGFRLTGVNGTPNDAQGRPVGTLEQDTDDPRILEDHIIPLTERLAVYLTGEFDLGPAQLYGELLYNNRQTEQQRTRQFFPWSRNALFGNDLATGGNQFASVILPANCLNEGTGTYTASCGPAPSFIRPIALIPFNTSVDIDYWYGVAGVRGDFGPNFGFLSNWSWDASLSHSISDGSYTRDTVDVRNVEDALDARSDVRHVLDGGGNVVCVRPSDGSSCVAINYFTTDFMAGNLTQEQRDFLFTTDTGNTEYTQTTFNAIMTGEAFSLPAGPVGVAMGVEYRRSEIDDQPGPLSFGNNQWGLTSAVNTQGVDELYEIFGEVEVPLLAGLPGIESLTLNASGRYFDYDLYDADSVYKLGANWQINPLLRLRATYGTSFRAPGLFELYLGNQTGFGGQGIDPCIDWGTSTNVVLQANCAADGIPDNYAGVGPSALIISGGGAGVLRPETSDSLTVGLIFTPTELALSIALDYFEIEVNDQVAQLGGGNILAACYGSPVFPNDFCNLFVRNTDPLSPGFLNIVSVNNNFVNINSQRTVGLDATVRYEHEFSFGRLSVDANGTWTFEDVVDAFGGLNGFTSNDFNGQIGQPDFVARANIGFRRGDWTYSWFSDYTQRMSNDQAFGGNIFDFRGDNGLQQAFFKQTTETLITHGASVRYVGGDWSVIAGVRNIFDEQPPFVSTGTTSRLGNASLSATQFDLRGRSAFFQVARTF